MQGQSIATAADLPKLVGYQQLRELYGWPKRTVQDWIKARKFPKPLNLPGRGNYWALDDITSWMKGDLARVAVTRPEDLSPEQVEDAAVDLLVRVAEYEVGESIDPRGLRVTYAPPSPEVTEEQFANAEAREAALLQQRFAGLDATRSTIVAAWLFPELREAIAAGTADVRARAAYLDPHKLAELARQALSDEAWAAANADLDAPRPKRGH
jgi:predicted DNA-binding transcriptional regulator AlpA